MPHQYNPLRTVHDSLRADGSGHDPDKVLAFAEEAMEEIKAGKRQVEPIASWPGDGGMYYVFHARHT